MAPDDPQRILLIQLQQLGDVILSSTLLEDLRTAFPAAQLDILTRAGPAQLLRGNPYLSNVVIYDADHPLRMPWRIRARRYDCVIDAQSSPRSAQVVLASGARRRIGWGISGPWRLVYNDRVPRLREPPGYVVPERQRLVQRLGVPVTAQRPRLYLTEDERARGAADVAALGTPPGAARVGMVLSAGSPPSMWPVERFAELVKGLAADGIAPVVIRTRGDEELVSRCLQLAGAGWRADVPDLRQFLGLLASLDQVVCGGTGPVQMAMALDVPTVTLYGPTHARHWSPGLPTMVAVNSPRASCPACARGDRRTAKDHRCMLEIDVATVQAHVRALLNITRVGAQH